MRNGDDELKGMDILPYAQGVPSPSK